MTTKIYSVSDTQTKIQIDGTDVVTIDKVGGIQKNSIQQMPVLGTAQNTTSGTSIDFTGIPSWAKRITLMFNGVSLSGTSSFLIQIGAGSIDNASYVSQSNLFPAGGTSVGINPSTGFGLLDGNAANILSGHAILTNVSGNIWVMSGNLASSATTLTVTGAGTKTLSGVLDRVRLTTVNGTDTFDAGSVNIYYE